VYSGLFYLLVCRCIPGCAWQQSFSLMAGVTSVVV
jgi:hypothetical protein